MKSSILPNLVSIFAIVLFLSVGTRSKKQAENEHIFSPDHTEDDRFSIWEIAQADGCQFYDQKGKRFDLRSLVHKNVVFSTFVMQCSPQDVQAQLALARVRSQHPGRLVFISLALDNTEDSGSLLADYAAYFSKLPGTGVFLRGDANSLFAICKLIFGADYSPYAADSRVAYIDSTSDEIKTFRRWDLEFLLTLFLSKSVDRHIEF